MARHRPFRWPLIAAFLACLAAGAALRLARLPELPLGLHYDEAANGILAAEIARGIKHPVFIPSYTGKEVLFFYWAAAWMRVLGEGVLALRLTAAVAGICTVAAAAWATCELLHDREDAPWIGAFTAAFLATSLWHLIFSRIGFRAITQPLLQALTVGALWRGLRLERRGWLVLAGLLAGATLYTYLASRAFPLPLAVALLALLLTDRERRRIRLGHILLFGVAAIAALIPLAAYFIAHPAALTTRIGQVAARSWAEAWEGLRACLGMFFLKGDPYIRFNLPGRPLFDPPTAALFLLGLLITFRRLFDRPGRPLPIASGLFLLTLLPIMLLPSALATGEITPSNLRAIGLLPFIYSFPALAAVSLLRSVVPAACLDRWALGLILFFLALQAPVTSTLYTRWATSPALYEAADGDLVDVAAYLNGTDLEGVTPYIASIHYRHPTLAFLAKDYPRLKWLTGGETLVFPAGGDGLLILPRSADQGRRWIEERLAEAVRLPTPAGPDGQPAFIAYRFPAGSSSTPSHPLSADFGHAVALLGYDLLSTPRSGEQADVVVYWRVENRPDPGDLLPAVRLTDPWGGLWGESRPFHYPAEQWTPGEVVMDHLSVKVAPGAPPGAYQLKLSFYAASTGQPLPLLDATGGYAGTAVGLPVELERATTPPAPSDLPIRQRLNLESGAGPTLLGVSLDTRTIRPGEPVHLTLFWQAARPVQADLTVHLQLGEERLYEGMPVHNTYPTSQWAAGEVVADRYDPRLSREAAPGACPLTLTLLDGEGREVLGPVTLGEITVERVDRTFEPPSMAHEVGIPLGDQAELLGYDLDPSDGQLRVTLYWRATAEMESSYTVFVHLLGPEGGVVAQHDGIPAGGGYPTPLWMEGEVVADPHILDLPAGLPPGSYTLEVGMYIQETGERLPVPDSPDGAVRIPVQWPETR